MPKSLIIVLILFVVTGLGILVLWPKYQTLAALRSQTALKSEEVGKLDSYFSTLETLSEEIRSYPESLSKIDSALPSDPSVPSLLRFIQKKASENGLILKGTGSFSTTPVEKDVNLKQTSIDFSVAGSYSSLKSFLKTLEKTDRLIEVDAVSFSFPSEEKTISPEAEVIFSFKLNIKTHSY